MCGRRPWRSGFAASTSGRWVKTRRNARIVGPWREMLRRDAKTRPAFEAQRGSCPRRSAAVIVRNKWWPRDDFHDARWNSFQSHPTQGATVEEPFDAWEDFLCAVSRCSQGAKYCQALWKTQGYNSWGVFFFVKVTFYISLFGPDRKSSRLWHHKGSFVYLHVPGSSPWRVELANMNE